MASIEEKVNKTPSVRITEDDYKNAEKVNLEKKPASTAFSEALEDSAKLQELRERKKEQLTNAILDVKEKCERWDIEFSELL